MRGSVTSEYGGAYAGVREVLRRGTVGFPPGTAFLMLRYGRAAADPAGACEREGFTPWYGRPLLYLQLRSLEPWQGRKRADGFKKKGLTSRPYVEVRSSERHGLRCSTVGRRFYGRKTPTGVSTSSSGSPMGVSPAGGSSGGGTKWMPLLRTIHSRPALLRRSRMAAGE